FTSTSSGHSHVWAKRIIPAAETSIYPSEFTASFHSPATRNFTVPALRAATMGAWFFKIVHSPSLAWKVNASTWPEKNSRSGVRISSGNVLSMAFQLLGLGDGLVDIAHHEE